MRLRKKNPALALLAFIFILVGLELFCRLYLGLGDPPLSRADPEIEYPFVGPRVYHRFGHTIEYNSFSQRTHDFADAPTWEPVVGVAPEFPDAICPNITDALTQAGIARIAAPPAAPGSPPPL